MNAGKLRHRISIETVSTSRDAYGQTGEADGEYTSVPFATVWGQVQDLSGRELYAAEEMHSQITVRITCRFFPGIVPAMIARVPMDQRTRVFDIMSVVDPDGRRRTLDLECKERVD